MRDSDGPITAHSVKSGPIQRFDEALLTLTSRAAEVLGVSERIGSLEPGKDADLALYDRDPFEYSSNVELVLVGGVPAYRR